MKNYIGRKCKGFRFEDEIDGVRWGSDMFDIIGQVGEVVAQGENHVNIEFNNFESWLYPISVIESYLIPETPEIPQLGEGVEMEVSNDHILWYTRNIIAQMQDGWYIINDGTIWKYARPIPEVKKYTKDELVKIVGHDFEIV
jgi:hypothetical protein